MVTDMQPTYIQAEADAALNGKQVAVSVWGRNLGWATYHLEVQAQVFHEGGTHQTQRWPVGQLEGREEFNFSESFTLDDDISRAPVQQVLAQLHWGTGQQTLQAWPPPLRPPFYNHPVFRSGVGAMVAVVVLWVGVPAVLRALRHSRG